MGTDYRLDVETVGHDSKLKHNETVLPFASIEDACRYVVRLAAHYTACGHVVMGVNVDGSFVNLCSRNLLRSAFSECLNLAADTFDIDRQMSDDLMLETVHISRLAGDLGITL